MITPKKSIMLYLLCLVASCTINARRIPRLTIVLVVDQLSYRKLMELKPYFTGGFHRILEHGAIYHNMHHNYAGTATAPGHATLATGVPPAIHGIVANAWYIEKDKKIHAEDDSAERAAVFDNQGSFYNYGKSAHNIMVDGITDQFVLASKPYAKHQSFSLSFKPRSAVCTANKLGKAIWLDEKSGKFTSSKAYFDELPKWLTKFNDAHGLDKLTSITWERAYKKRDYPYRMFSKDASTIALFGKEMAIDRSQESPYEHFLQSPQSIYTLFDLARTCVDAHTSKNPGDKLLLWLCPSSLDTAGHEFGPDSVQATDLIYHFDLAFHRLYNHITKHIRKKDVLIVITADHGMGHSPEDMQAHGYTSAHRTGTKEVTEKLNTIAHEQCSKSNLILQVDIPNVFFDEPLFGGLASKTQGQTLSSCKEWLLKQPGVVDAWTVDELMRMPADTNEFIQLFKNQVFKGRSGQLIVQMAPYCYLTQDPNRYRHKSPYNYDTHIPFIIYQCGSHERAQHYEKVTSLQCAPTLAYLMGIPRPSAALQPLLPGLTPPNDPCF